MKYWGTIVYRGRQSGHVVWRRIVKLCCLHKAEMVGHGRSGTEALDSWGERKQYRRLQPKYNSVQRNLRKRDY